MIHLCHPSNLFSHCVPFPPLCPFPSGPLASRPAWLPAPADVYHWFIRAQNGWHFPLPAICWHCFSRCLRTSEHLDFLLPLQHFNMSHIISRLLIVQLTFLSFVFLFVMHIFKFWHITHINYWEKKGLLLVYYFECLGWIVALVSKVIKETFELKRLSV